MSNLPVVSEAVFVSILKSKFNNLIFCSRLYKSVKIFSLGKENLTDGPDFVDATVQFDDNIEQGDIEVHINSSSWYSHNHHTDSKYKNTILNLCLKDDSHDGYNIYSDDKIVPIAYIEKDTFKRVTRELKMSILANKVIKVPGLCMRFNTTNNIKEYLWRFGLERFANKIKKFKSRIENYGLEEAFYISLLESLGYVHNTQGFILLAQEITFSYLKKLYKSNNISKPDDIYALYFHAVSRLDKSASSKLWNKKFIYPKSKPLLRLKQISPFVFLLLSQNISSFLEQMYMLYNEDKLEKFLKEYIASPFIVRSIIFNILLPFIKITVVSFCADDLYKCKALPTNYLVRQALKRMFSDKEKVKLNREIYQQGIMYLSKNYCSYGLKGCEWCPLYNEYTN
ncbi:MAG: DUF2851 family protein [Planctomycetota bacterium]